MNKIETLAAKLFMAKQNHKDFVTIMLENFFELKELSEKELKNLHQLYSELAKNEVELLIVKTSTEVNAAKLEDILQTVSKKLNKQLILFVDQNEEYREFQILVGDKEIVI